MEALHMKEHNKFSYSKWILWKSIGTFNCLVTDIHQNIFFCVQQKKEIHTGLEQLESE